MKCKVLFFIFLITSFTAIGQNLVPNPSFEEYTECPDSPLELDVEGAYPWTSFRQTPDFFHPCDETGTMSSPNSTAYGYGIPFHGVGKAGLIGIGGTFNREILGVELNEPLILDQTYFVSFFLLRTFGGGAHANCDCASNNLGLKFTTTGYSITATVPIDNFAHIMHEDVLTDTTFWTQVSGWVMADSAYSHLAIGTFFTNDFITVENYNNDQGLPKTYYFIDAVCVSQNPSDCDVLNSVENDKGQFPSDLLIYPNPAFNILNVKSSLGMTSYKISNVLGKELNYNRLNSDFESIDVSYYSKGLYIISVQFENGTSQNVSFLKY